MTELLNETRNDTTSPVIPNLTIPTGIRRIYQRQGLASIATEAAALVRENCGAGSASELLRRAPETLLTC
ncbi:MAG: hypothetical protein ABI114_04570 [Rhodanobacter sp.]